MARVPPGKLLLGRQPLIEATAALDAAWPEEGCGLLLGTADGDWRIRHFWPCLNVWEPAAERRRHFLLDPREQLQAQRWGRRFNWLVLGAIHSHPEGEPVPSGWDRQLVLAPALLLIAAPARSRSTTPAVTVESWQLAAWWLAEEGQAVRSLTLEVEVGGG